jgi:hypothetical protein
LPPAQGTRNSGAHSIEGVDLHRLLTWRKWRKRYIVGGRVGLVLVLVLFSAAGNVVGLFKEDADSVGGDFVVDYGLVGLYGVNAEFFGWEVSKDLKR